ncbi:MAG: hypothetical protein Q6K90_08085, partial [Gloeomargarita sp. HHBFW_bins_162]
MGNSMVYSPLYDCYKNEAKLTEFAGWMLPAQFTGLTPEHQAVRQGAGLFDISHMGQIELKGERVIADLNGLIPTDITHLSPGHAQYTVLLNEQGGIIDDIIIYVQRPTQVKLIVNAACTAKNLAWLQHHLPAVEIRRTPWVLLALQGVQATRILQTLTPDTLATIPRFGHQLIQTEWGQIWVARTGYTGEDGWEIQVEPSVGQALWHE